MNDLNKRMTEIRKMMTHIQHMMTDLSRGPGFRWFDETDLFFAAEYAEKARN